MYSCFQSHYVTYKIMQNPCIYIVSEREHLQSVYSLMVAQMFCTKITDWALLVLSFR